MITDSQCVTKTPWMSIITVSVLSFCSAIQFSLYFSSTWPYLRSLDESVTESYYGKVISSFSLGQMIGSAFFGWWSNKIENVRAPCTICLLVSFFGNLVYVLAAINPLQSRYLVLTARFIVGIGAGNTAILKSYAAMASRPEDRSQAISWITGGVSLGSTIGPALQLLFTPIGNRGWRVFDNIYLNMYTAPAFFACFINIIGIVFLWSMFSEKYAGLVEMDRPKDKSVRRDLFKYDLVAVFVCHVTFFAHRFTFTNLETLGAPIGQSIFAWTKTEVVFYIGLFHAFFSFVALLTNVVFVVFKMERVLNFRIFCFIGLLGLTLFHVITFDWPFINGKVKTYTQDEYIDALANNEEITGCNVDRFAWCNYTNQLNMWIFYASYIFIIGVFFPVINITVNTLFSRILGPQRIAAAQGLLHVTGSFARLCGPVLISNLYSEYGLRHVWILECFVLGVALFFWLRFYNRLVPLEVHEVRKRDSLVSGDRILISD